jgi:hypothetical protein
MFTNSPSDSFTYSSNTSPCHCVRHTHTTHPSTHLHTICSCAGSPFSLTRCSFHRAPVKKLHLTRLVLPPSIAPPTRLTIQLNAHRVHPPMCFSTHTHRNVHHSPCALRPARTFVAPTIHPATRMLWPLVCLHLHRDSRPSNSHFAHPLSFSHFSCRLLNRW